MAARPATRRVAGGIRIEDPDDRLITEVDRALAGTAPLEGPEVGDRRRIRRRLLRRQERVDGAPPPRPPKGIDRQEPLVDEPDHERAKGPDLGVDTVRREGLDRTRPGQPTRSSGLPRQTPAAFGRVRRSLTQTTRVAKSSEAVITGRSRSPSRPVKRAKSSRCLRRVTGRQVDPKQDIELPGLPRSSIKVPRLVLGESPVIVPSRETITVTHSLRSCTIGERRAMALRVGYMPFRRSSS